MKNMFFERLFSTLQPLFLIVGGWGRGLILLCQSGQSAVLFSPRLNNRVNFTENVIQWIVNFYHALDI